MSCNLSFIFSRLIICKTFEFSLSTIVQLYQGGQF